MTPNSVKNGRVPLAGLKAAVSSVATSAVVGRWIGRLTSGRATFRGHSVFLPTTVAGPIRASVFWGLYEKAEATFVERYVPVGQVVVELGSSLGIVATVIARRQPRSMVCVEANQTLVESIKRNLALSAPAGVGTVINRAIDYTGTPTVRFTVDDNSLISSVRRSTGASERTVEVPTATLSTILAEQQIGSYVLVMDIEGAEVGVLIKDAVAFRNCSLIVAELHAGSFEGIDYSIEDLVSRFRELDFDVIDRRGPVCVFVPRKAIRTT